MKITQIRYAVAVADQGSLRSAARYLGVAQPSISRSIQDLEFELDAELFSRTRNGMIPTVIGEAFLRRAKTMQAELDRSFDEVQQMIGGESSTLVLAMSSDASVGLLPKILGAFRLKYPDVKLDVNESPFQDLEKDLRDGVFDMFVGEIPDEYADPSIEIERLRPSRFFVLARQGHPQASAVSMTQLVKAEWLTRSVRYDGENEVGLAFRSMGFPAPRIVAEVDSGLSALSIIAASDTLGFAPEPWRPLLQSFPAVREIEVEDFSLSSTLCIARRAGAMPTPAGGHMTALLREALQPAAPQLEHKPGAKRAFVDAEL